MDCEQDVKKFEELDNKVALYFTELNNDPICVPFKINENVFVENHIEATVLLYDYYKPEMKISKTYTMNKCELNHVAPIPGLINNTIDIKHKIYGKDSIIAANNISEKNNQSFIETNINLETNATNLEETNTSKIVKRSAANQPNKNNENFVDMNVEMETPDCYEHPIIMKPNTTHTIQKRSVNITEEPKYNHNFVNKDIEMAMPDGMEGNWPQFAMPKRPMN